MRQSAKNDTGPESLDSYLTIKHGNSAEIKIQGSRFLSYAVPVRDETAFQEHLDGLRKQHYNATHHCFAWKIGSPDERFRCNDDGEPSGTAGKRILGSLDRFGLTDTAVVVVRYFGGTKLGVGGLARAYSDSADAVLQTATIVRRYLTAELRIRFPYDCTSQVHHVLELHDAGILDRKYEDFTIYRIRVRKSKQDVVERELTDLTNRTVEIEITDNGKRGTGNG